MFELERKPGNVQRQKKKEKKKKKQMKKDDILGFGETFFTGETSSKSEIRNSAKKSFWRFSVARSEVREKKTKKTVRNRHIHVISFHSVEGLFLYFYFYLVYSQIWLNLPCATSFFNI